MDGHRMLCASVRLFCLRSLVNVPPRGHDVTPAQLFRVNAGVGCAAEELLARRHSCYPHEICSAFLYCRIIYVETVGIC